MIGKPSGTARTLSQVTGHGSHTGHTQVTGLRCGDSSGAKGAESASCNKSTPVETEVVQL